MQPKKGGVEANLVTKRATDVTVSRNLTSYYPSTMTRRNTYGDISIGFLLNNKHIYIYPYLG